MDLKTYLSDRTQKEFAQSLGVSQGLVSQWVRGRCKVSFEYCQAIERVTDGAVTWQELRPDLVDFWRQVRAGHSRAKA